jgi:excreted virulence factor EspC (type VII ESX diderm)
MLPVQVSSGVLAELADALDTIAAALGASVAATGSDFGTVGLPRRGFAATAATESTIDVSRRAIGAIEVTVAETAAAMRTAATAYAGADARAAGRPGPRPW